MASSFGGINTALSALYAQRRGLDVTGQNIANANTEGYSRQRVSMQSQVGSLRAAMYAKTDGLGTGVAVSDVQRLRDEFLENRGRTEHGANALLATQATTYTSIEDAFAEPGETALAAQLRDMWGSWNDVANNPQLEAPRSALIQQSATVADQLNAAHESLARQWKQNEAQMSGYVDEVNGTARSIAQLNDSIIKANASSLPVNELEDRRDQLAMKLAELTGATAAKRPNGGMDVFIGGSTLVTGTTVREVDFIGATRLEDQATNAVSLIWKDNVVPPQKVDAGGTMGGMVDTMTNIIPNLSAELDSVANNLITTVNDLHRTGYSVDGSTGSDFFGREADGSVAVLITDPDKVAIAATNGTLDNSIADKIADIGESPDGPDREYQGMIGRLGVSAQGIARRSEIQSVVTEQVDAAREGEAGVNLDEEMTNLLTYQRGYEAASRVLTTIDSMLDQLINRTGLVGR
ncbi:flagellar hook-associated protein FlgK [Couchioplanes caeruleus]|uniref:Flagellar hook-associated protein 1 n=2 Tax=Couchioplanes caeruleus TaxID=56438 RepID=A0A1K0GHW3_9ACTN|nr:flagellar hook-associated protein FlgK [Couchioplanes caeruleus]OJF11822.1 flagellar hook-associated protein FlgK [Couchioplanes caeruleus subsp. caeruleus]ROP31742.1 flagellar hook-associated protein 1 FlgK [Couchioplanes caeruleus]